MRIRLSRTAINRILFFICTLLLMAGCYSFAANYAKQQTVEAISAKVLRFHVIAKSDSEEDQRRKLMVRDAVGEWMRLKLSNAKDKADCEEIIEENKDQIKALAEQVHDNKREDYHKTAGVAYRGVIQVLSGVVRLKHPRNFNHIRHKPDLCVRKEQIGIEIVGPLP